MANVLAGWIFVQLLIVGFIGGLAYNDYADCKPHVKATSSWSTPIMGAMFPVVFFISDLPANENCTNN